MDRYGTPTDNGFMFVRDLSKTIILMKLLSKQNFFHQKQNTLKCMCLYKRVCVWACVRCVK